MLFEILTFCKSIFVGHEIIEILDVEFYWKYAFEVFQTSFSLSQRVAQTKQLRKFEL
jgi:hypothetical protein